MGTFKESPDLSRYGAIPCVFCDVLVPFLLEPMAKPTLQTWEAPPGRISRAHRDVLSLHALPSPVVA